MNASTVLNYIKNPIIFVKFLKMKPELQELDVAHFSRCDRFRDLIHILRKPLFKLLSQHTVKKKINISTLLTLYLSLLTWQFTAAPINTIQTDVFISRVFSMISGGIIWSVEWSLSGSSTGCKERLLQPVWEPDSWPTTDRTWKDYVLALPGGCPGLPVFPAPMSCGGKTVRWIWVLTWWGISCLFVNLCINKLWLFCRWTSMSIRRTPVAEWWLASSATRRRPSRCQHLAWPWRRML